MDSHSTTILQVSDLGLVHKKKKIKKNEGLGLFILGACLFLIHQKKQRKKEKKCRQQVKKKKKKIMLKSQNFKESGSLLIDKCSKLFEVWHDDFN